MPTRAIVYITIFFLLGYDAICLWRQWPTISEIVVEIDKQTGWFVLPVLTGILLHFWLLRVTTK